MKDKNLVHYFEVSDVLNQFVAAFDSIVIGRYRGRDLKNPVPVRFTYAPKQATLHALNNKAEHITVPVISVSISGIARDAERVQKKNTGHFINRITETDRIPAPVPVNISVNMSILTKTQEDMDQILANFIPYSNPYIILSWKIPSEFTSEEIELRSEVLWDENISITQPIERNESDRFRTVADTTFTIKAWLFKRHDDNPMGNIFEIDADFYPIKELGEVLSDLDVVDQLGLSAYPDFSFQQEVRHVIGTTPTQKLEGTNFSYTDTVYLSADSPTIFDDPLEDQGEFYGIPLDVDEYDIIDDNVLYVNIRELQDVGNMRIIVENPSGYASTGEIPIITL